MRFFLDNDVDDAVRTMLRRARHEAWTAAMAGLADASDDVLSVYADDRRAVLLTHDREFTTRRRRRPIGQHVRLACHEWEAADTLRRNLRALTEILRGRREVNVVVAPGKAPTILEPDYRD